MIGSSFALGYDMIDREVSELKQRPASAALAFLLSEQLMLMGSVVGNFSQVRSLGNVGAQQEGRLLGQRRLRVILQNLEDRMAVSRRLDNVLGLWTHQEAVYFIGIGGVSMNGQGTSHPRKRYDAEFKRESVRLADTSGKTDRQIERDPGIIPGGAPALA